MYDLVIVGAGPAGLTAALYARRAGRSVLALERETFGGQIARSPRVENYPGFAQVSGAELADRMLDQALSLGVDTELDAVTGVEGTAGDFTVYGRRDRYRGRAVIVAAGSRHRRLGLPREDEFLGRGVSYCAVCDGPFYLGRTVAVAGGGNSALQEIILLSGLCEKVYVIQDLPRLTGEARLREEAEGKPNVEILLSSVVTAIEGGDTFRGITVSRNGQPLSLAADGLFVAVGLQPENGPFRSLLPLDEQGYIACGESCVPDGGRPGLFAAGDCRTKSVRQLTTAVADGASAAVAACRFLDSL